MDYVLSSYYALVVMGLFVSAVGAIIVAAMDSTLAEVGQTVPQH
jgi:hypothetical protein